MLGIRETLSVGETMFYPVISLVGIIIGLVSSVALLASPHSRELRWIQIAGGFLIIFGAACSLGSIWSAGETVTWYSEDIGEMIITLKSGYGAFLTLVAGFITGW